MKNHAREMNKEQVKTSLETAQDYLSRKWQPLPIPHKSKNPNFQGWQNFKTGDKSELAEHFNGKPQNVGVLLGEVSGGLVDLDLDAANAVKLAEFFLPETSAIFGRESKRKSHYLYICKDAKTEKFQFDEMIAEIRAGGCQTVFPNSTHPTGEKIFWEAADEPETVSFDDLRLSVGKLASACLIAGFWKDTKRHELALAISGALLRNGFSFEDTMIFVKAVCFAVNDDETDDRLKAVETTFERIRNNKNIYGLPKLSELTGDKAVKTLVKWLNLNPKIQVENSPAKPLTSNKTLEISENELPDKYVLSENGLFYLGEDRVFICSPLRVTANTSDSQNESWGKLLEFEDTRGGKHSLVIPMSSLSTEGAECRARLMDSGLIVSANKKAREYLLNYLLTAKPKKHILCVSQLGWHDEAFVLPDEVISADESGKEILLQNVDRTANKFQTSGTLTEWQENIARYCVGNSRLMFAVCTAFAASLLPIAEDTSGGFHLHGTSSTGKTTALLVAGSVWGGDKRKGFLETWRATSNGLEAVAESHNNSLLLLDEISQINPHDVGEVIYSLSNGFGKSRMNKNISARRKTEWNLLFFSSGEKTLEQVMQGIGQRLFAGQETRFVNIEADAAAGLGLFETLHGFDTSDDLAKYLSSASKKFYGAAIRKFLQNVCENRDFVEQQIKSIRKYFTAKFSPRDTSGEVFRVASRFALVAVAGILACEFGVVGWSKDDVLTCVEKLLAEWIKTRGTIGNYDAAQGVKQVLAFIEQHGASRFQSVAPQKDFNGNEISERIINRAGFKREGQNGQTEFLILPEMFDREMCKGFSPNAVAKELEKLGHLRRGSEKNYIQAKVSLPELGQKRVYVIAYESDFDEKC